MTLVDAALVLTGLLLATVLLGVYLRWQQNRPRRQNPAEVVDPRRWGEAERGEEATLLQFSTEFCTRCPGAHRTLREIAEARPGVVHLDVDLTHRPDIAEHFHILQTPTVFILDRHGVVKSRFGGVPSRHVVELELSRVVGDPVAR